MQRFIDENGYEYYVDLSGNYTPTGRRLRIKQKNNIQNQQSQNQNDVQNNNFNSNNYSQRTNNIENENLRNGYINSQNRYNNLNRTNSYNGNFNQRLNIVNREEINNRNRYNDNYENYQRQNKEYERNYNVSKSSNERNKNMNDFTLFEEQLDNNIYSDNGYEENRIYRGDRLNISNSSRDTEREYGFDKRNIPVYSNSNLREDLNQSILHERNRENENLRNTINPKIQVGQRREFKNYKPTNRFENDRNDLNLTDIFVYIILAGIFVFSIYMIITGL